ncbi:CRISPR-associated endonuclease Cas2 [Pyrobaculum sp.]|uniref:CRISPR-associated endonuclease Cas2 n=1 Tax=Pyrobaculum sp. TaxID=2004705 RepID=UPI003D0A96CC
MHILVVYDITEDHVRNKVAEVLRSYGLARVQKSAYIGRLPPAYVKELAERLARAVRGANADIIILKIDRKTLETMIRIGPPPPSGRGPALH